MSKFFNKLKNYYNTLSINLNSYYNNSMTYIKNRHYIERIKLFFGVWQDLLILLPISAIAVLVLYRYIPYFDARAALDGFGDLFIFFVSGVKVVAIFFAAWMAKRIYFFCIPRHEEVRIYTELSNPDIDKQYKKDLIKIKVIDRLEWIFLVGIISYITL